MGYSNFGCGCGGSLRFGSGGLKKKRSNRRKHRKHRKSRKVLRRKSSRRRSSRRKSNRRRFGNSNIVGAGYQGDTFYPTTSVEYFGAKEPWVNPPAWWPPVTDGQVQLNQNQIAPTTTTTTV